MKKFIFLLLPLFLLASVVSVSQQKKELPKVVLDAFAKAYPKAAIQSYSSVQNGGKLRYEIKSIDGKMFRSVDYDTSGILTMCKETHSLNELPRHIQVAVDNGYRGETVDRAVVVTQDGPMRYEIYIKVVFDSLGVKQDQ